MAVVPAPPSENGSRLARITAVVPSARAEGVEGANAPTRRENAMPEGYCVKERKKVEIKDPEQITMKNGRPAIKGTCPDCGTKIFKIGKMD